MNETNEPLVTTAGIVAGVSAVITLLVAFGVPVTEDQAKAILGVVGIAAPLIVAWVGRRWVTPTTNVVEFKRAGTRTIVAGPANDRIESGTVVRRLDPAA